MYLLFANFHFELAKSWVVYTILSCNSLRINMMGFYQIANDDHTTKRIKAKEIQILEGQEAINHLSLPISPEKCILTSKYRFPTLLGSQVLQQRFTEKKENILLPASSRVIFQQKVMST